MNKIVVSSEMKTACNFQTMGMNFFVMQYDLIRGQIGSSAYMQTKDLKNRPKKHIYIKQQSQNQPAKS